MHLVTIVLVRVLVLLRRCLMVDSQSRGVQIQTCKGRRQCDGTVLDEPRIHVAESLQQAVSRAGLRVDVSWA